MVEGSVARKEDETRPARGLTDYERWQAAEGIPIYKGAFLADLHEVELAPWSRVGAKGAFVNLADQLEDDGWVIELPPASQTEVLHHAFELSLYVVEGRGATTFWQPGQPPQTVEWQRGSILSPPLNCYYQHFNADGQQRVRMFMVTNAPMVINIYRNLDFIFDNPFVFNDRYSGEADYFSGAGESMDREGNWWKTNFIPDVRTLKLAPSSRGWGGASGMQWSLSNNQCVGHCTLMPAGTYKRAHRHGIGAHLVILDGQGYSLLWFEDEEATRVDWKDGTVISPMEGQFHQHFSTGQGAVRYMAFRMGALDMRPATPRRTAQGAQGLDEGIRGIPYDLEDPAIYDLYVEECAKNGAEVVLPRPAYRTTK